MHLLKEHFSNAMLEDYDYPIHDSEKRRHQKAEWSKSWNALSSKWFFKFRKTECIHGHFLPYKYDFFYESGDHTFVTWLRDPFERMESHYHYWKQHHQKMEKRPLLKKFLQEDWTLEEFAFCREIQNIYSLFLWNFPIQRFQFLGVTEFFEEDLLFFSEHYLGRSDIEIPEKNMNTEKRKVKSKDPGFIREFKEFHAEDYEIYNYALEQRMIR